MAEISTNIILDGITLALRSAFPDSHIEVNAIKQGLNPPAFIVLMVSNEYETYPNSRQKRLPRFDIIYFPTARREECYEMADKLVEVLDVIELPSGDKLRGSDVSIEISEDVLHVLISYNHFVYKPAEQTYMSELELGGM